MQIFQNIFTLFVKIYRLLQRNHAGIISTSMANLISYIYKNHSCWQIIIFDSLYFLICIQIMAALVASLFHRSLCWLFLIHVNAILSIEIYKLYNLLLLL